MADKPSNRRANESCESSATIDSSSTTPSSHAIVEGPSPAASLQSITIATPSTVSSSSASSSSPSSGQTTSQAIPSTALISVVQSQEISGQKHEPPASSPGSSHTAHGKPTGAIPKKRDTVSGKGPKSPSKTKSSTADFYPLSLHYGREKSSLGRKSERSSSERDLPGDSPESPTHDLRPALELGATAAEAAAELGGFSSDAATELWALRAEVAAELEDSTSDAAAELGAVAAGAAAELGAAPREEYDDDEEDEGLRMILSSPESSSSTLRAKIKIKEINKDFPQYWEILYTKYPPTKTKKDGKPEGGKFFFPVPDEEVMGRAQSRIMVDNIYIKKDLILNGIEFTTLWEEDDATNTSLKILKKSFIAVSVPAPQLPQVGSTSTGRVCDSFTGTNDCALQMNYAYMDIITYYMYYFLHRALKRNPDMRPLTSPTPGEMMIYANYGTMKFFRVKWSGKGAAEFKTAAEIATGPTKLVKESVEVPEPDAVVFEGGYSRKAEEEKKVEGGYDDNGSDDDSDSLKVDEIKLPVECVDYCTEIMAEVVNLYKFVGRYLLPLKYIPPQGLKVTVYQINNKKRNISGNLEQRFGKLVRVTTAATVEGIEGELTRVVLHDA